MALSNAAKTSLFNLIFGKTTSNSLMTNCYLGLSTTAPTDGAGSGFTEPASNTGYARALLGNAQSAVTQLMEVTNVYTAQNKSIIYFPEALSSWGTITHWGLFSAATGGNPLFYGPLSAAVEVPPNYVPLFRVGAFTMTIT